MNAILRFALVGVLSVVPVSIACAQFNPFAVVSVHYYPDRVATPYDFQVWYASAVDNDAVTIKAPDGTIFDTVPESGSIYYDLPNLTAADVNRYMGLWTINDSQGLPSGAAPQQHTFNVSQGDLRPLTSMPRIVSPGNGAVLPPIFEIKSSQGGVSLRSPEDAGSVKRLSLSPGVGTYQFLFNPGVTEVEIEARASDQVVDIRGTSAPDQANRRFNVWMIRNIHSPYSSFTVSIPEPSTLALASVALLSLAALRRRK